MPDVNVLVYAHRTEEPAHDAYRDWLRNLIDGREPFALSVLVAVGFVRIVTNRRIFSDPTPTDTALAVIESIATHPDCRLCAPGAGHFSQVAELCRKTRATGKLVADAQHAAIAMAEGCVWVTRDSDYRVFTEHGLRWDHLDLG